jgi:RNA polymerase subunit RPABC4/transcription elongation factor Spt4
VSPAKKATTETTPCPWCSAAVPTDAATCPSCGASLRDAAEGDVAGVTQIDPNAVSKVARIRPSGLSGWLGAERTTENPDLSGRVEPPSEEVRREMLRLELAALDAEIQAKTSQVQANAVLPPDGAPQTEQH